MIALSTASLHTHLTRAPHISHTAQKSLITVPRVSSELKDRHPNLAIVDTHRTCDATSGTTRTHELFQRGKPCGIRRAHCSTPSTKAYPRHLGKAFRQLNVPPEFFPLPISLWRQFVIGEQRGDGLDDKDLALFLVLGFLLGCLFFGSSFREEEASFWTDSRPNPLVRQLRACSNLCGEKHRWAIDVVRPECVDLRGLAKDDIPGTLWFKLGQTGLRRARQQLSFSPVRGVQNGTGSRPWLRATRILDTCRPTSRCATRTSLTELVMQLAMPPWQMRRLPSSPSNTSERRRASDFLRPPTSTRRREVRLELELSKQPGPVRPPHREVGERHQSCTESGAESRQLFAT